MTRARYILTNLKEDKTSGRAREILRKFDTEETTLPEGDDDEKRKSKSTSDSHAKRPEEG